MNFVFVAGDMEAAGATTSSSSTTNNTEDKDDGMGGSYSRPENETSEPNTDVLPQPGGCEDRAMEETEVMTPTENARSEEGNERNLLPMDEQVEENQSTWNKGNGGQDAETDTTMCADTTSTDTSGTDTSSSAVDTSRQTPPPGIIIPDQELFQGLLSHEAKALCSEMGIVDAQGLLDHEDDVLVANLVEWKLRQNQWSANGNGHVQLAKYIVGIWKGALRSAAAAAACHPMECKSSTTAGSSLSMDIDAGVAVVAAENNEENGRKKKRRKISAAKTIHHQQATSREENKAGTRTATAISPSFSKSAFERVGSSVPEQQSKTTNGGIDSWDSDGLGNMAAPMEEEEDEQDADQRSVIEIFSSSSSSSSSSSNNSETLAPTLRGLPGSVVTISTTASSTTSRTTQPFPHVDSLDVSESSSRDDIPERSIAETKPKRSAAARKIEDSKPKAKKLVATKKKVQKTDNDVIGRGTRVYAMWQGNNCWYFGKVTDVRELKWGLRYTVLFDDGDVATKVKPEHITTEKEYYATLDSGTPGKGSFTPKNSDACGSCALCLRSPCGKCHPCRTNDGTCFQKMCCELQEEEKAVPAPYFPEGWTFIFQGPEQATKYQRKHEAFAANNGLVLIAPKPNKMRRYQSIENAVAFKANGLLFVDTYAFYRYVGLCGPSAGEEAESFSASRTIGSRCYTRWSTSEWYWGKITNVEGKGKRAIFSIEFEDGGEELGGLGYNDLITEFQYYDKGTTLPAPSANARSASIGTAGSPDGKPAATFKSCSLQDLRKKRCKTCSMCRKDDCGKCRSCVSNKQVTSRYKAVCLFKMCLAIPDSEKAQPAFEQFDGWRFFTTDPSKLPRNKKDQGPICPELAGFCLLSPKGYRMRCVGRFANLRKMDAANLFVEDFYKSMFGLELIKQDNDHPLVGQEFLREWMDSNRRPQAVYGTITECHREYSGTLRFTVVYQKESRQLATAGVSDLMNYVPDRDENVNERNAWGGCRSAERVARESNPNAAVLDPSFGPSPCFNWIVPRLMHDEMVRLNDCPGMDLPRRTILVRGWNIVLQAKPSGIEGSGLGVWASCTPVSTALRDDADFVLRAGDLVDIGVYSPLRAQDRKPEHISILKNYIYSWACEAYGFAMAGHERNGQYNVLDITDDFTGDLHTEAQKCILPRVNETSSVEDEHPTVYAEHDPSGAVHYLLGHYDPSFGDFSLPGDGSEVEIKVDYGTAYEKIRVREGYSRVGVKEQEVIMQQIKEDDNEIVEDIHSSTANEVADDIAFVEKLWKANPNGIPNGAKRNRILLVALLLRARVLAIEDEFKGSEHDDDEPAAVDHGVNSMRSRQSGQRAKEIVRGVASSWDSAEALRSAMLWSGEDLKVGLVHSLNCKTKEELEAMTAEELRKRILDV